VPDIQWNEAKQLEVLRQGLSEELKDLLQHCNIPSDLTEFVKICSKSNSQIWPEEQTGSPKDAQQDQRDIKPQAIPHSPQKRPQQEQWQDIMSPLRLTSPWSKEK
jgi:hypothetical protein